MANIYAWNAFVINVVAFIAWQPIGVCGQIPRKLEENCILYYNFDQMQGGKVFDSSTKKRYDATMATHALKTKLGKCGNGIVLNAQPLTINTEFSMESQTKSQFQLTIAAWIYLNEPAELKTQDAQKKERKRTIFASYHSKGSRFLYFVIWNDKHLRWSASGENSTARNLFKPVKKQNEINVGAWHHVAVSYDFNNGEENCTFFVNGANVTGKSSNENLRSTQHMVVPLGLTPYIGSANGSEPLMGVVDDYYMFNKTLSQEEIQQLMNDTCKDVHSTMVPSGTDHTATTVSSSYRPTTMYTSAMVSSSYRPTAMYNTTMVSSSYRPTTMYTSTMESVSSTSRLTAMYTTTMISSTSRPTTMYTTTMESVSSTSRLTAMYTTTMMSSTSRPTTMYTTTMSSHERYQRLAENVTDKGGAKKFLSVYISDQFENNSAREEDAMSRSLELENIALILAQNTLKVNESVTLDTSSALLIIKLPSSGFTFPHKETGKIFTETISFPDDMVKAQDGVRRAFVCMAYYGLHESMSDEITMSSGPFKPNTTVQLNSKIIGAAVTPRLNKSLANPIEVTFHHAKISSGKQYCSFWNHSIRTANGTYGEWSTSGCHLDEEQSSSTKTVCLCNHLTNFALLLQREGVPYSDPPLSLKIITIIGCSLSVLACLICFIMFSTLKKKDIRHYLHINLTFAIAVAQLILLFGIDQTEYEILCKAMAALLHYFYLVAFLLMLCEAVHLAILIETAFSHGDVKLPVYLIASWGLPLIIVGITLGARHDNYGGSTACFISANQGTVYAFVGPFGLVLAINLVILIMVLRQVIMKTSLPISSKAASKFEIAKATIRSLVILFPVMGFTWIFGILFFGFRTLAFEYLFAIFCSLQGFFIFLFQYALNSENRLAFLRATKRLRLTLTSSTSTSANGTKQTVATKIKITSPSEHDDVGDVYTSAQDNCNLTAYRHADDKTVGTMDSRTGSTYI